MNCVRGDLVPLYHVFTDDEGTLVIVDSAEVRMLHEQGEDIYEDMPWTAMKPFADGFAAPLDTGEHTQADGVYVLVYRGHLDDKEYTDSEEIVVGQPKVDTTAVKVRVMGLVLNGGTGKPLGDVTVRVVTDGGALSTEVTTNFAGQWYAKVAPGDYTVTFACKGFGGRELRARVGDNNAETQFATVTLEPDNEAFRGHGAHRVVDVFTDKHDLGLSGMNMSVAAADAPDVTVAECTTNDRGEWRLHLDTGEYLARLMLPGGELKVFRLTVDDRGGHTLTEFKSAVAVQPTGEREELFNGSGAVAVHDVVVNSHGAGVPGVVVKAYAQIVLSETTVDENGQEVTTTTETLKFEYVAGDVTNALGEFTLNLDKGTYRMTFDGEGFKHLEQIVTV